MSDVPDWIKTPEEAAEAIHERYGVSTSTSTIVRWLGEGQIPGRYFYGRWLVYMPGTHEVLNRRTSWRPSPPRKRAA